VSSFFCFIGSVLDSLSCLIRLLLLRFTNNGIGRAWPWACHLTMY
jgi:hypothetical protein